MKFTFLYVFAALIASSLLITSCSDDPTFNQAPSTSITTTADVIDANGSFMVNVTGRATDNPLNSFSILKDGALIPASSVTLNGSTMPANARLLLADEKTSYDFDLIIQSDLGIGKSANYSFVTADEVGESSTESVSISVNDMVTPPTLTFNGSMSDLTIEPSTLYSVELDGTPGTSPLDSLAVYENGVLISNTRLRVNGALAASNPIALSELDEDGFTGLMLEMRASSEETTSAFRWVLIDAAGETDEFTRNIITQRASMMSGFITIPNVTLFNFAGPVAQGKKGCVDLSTGIAYFRTQDEDLGGICDLVDGANDSNGNWLSSLSPKNSAEIRVPNDVSLGTTFTTGTELINAFDNNSTAATSIASATDVFFLVKDKDGSYFGVRINGTTNTDDDNCDKHNMTIFKVAL